MIDEMQTRRKLREACYFCERLSQAKNDDEFYFNLSAFLNAWRGILDVMLYDLAEHYSLGFSREDLMSEMEFGAVANALKKNDAVKFIKWWRHKQGDLRKNPLWSERNITFHRGYPKISEYRIFVSPSGGTSVTITPYFKRVTYAPVSMNPPKDTSNYFFSSREDKTVILYCYESLNEIDRIIAEAENVFAVKL